MLSMCLDQNISNHLVGAFVEEFHSSLESHDIDYPIEVLVGMLGDPRLVEQTFDRYKHVLT